MGGLRTFLLLPKKWKLVQYLGGRSNKRRRGLFTFLLWNGHTCPPLPHTAADREIKVCAHRRQPNIFRFQEKSPMQTFFFRISVQTKLSQSRSPAFLGLSVLDFKCKMAALPDSSPFPRLSPGLRSLPSSPAVKLGYKGAEGVVGGNIN